MTEEQKTALLVWMCEQVYTDVRVVQGGVMASDPTLHAGLYDIRLTLDLLAKVELAVCEKYGLVLKSDKSITPFGVNYGIYYHTIDVDYREDVLTPRFTNSDETKARTEALYEVMLWAKKQEDEG